MALTIDVLGPLAVSTGSDKAAVDRPSHRRLLSLLALSAGRRISTEVLIDRYWTEDPPPTAKAAIQTHIAALRRALGDEAIATEGYGYRLAIENGSLDSHVFDSLAQAASQATAIGDWDEALEAAGTALELWRGDPYPSLVDDGFARPEITRLTELHLELLERRAEALISLGREAESLPDLEALVMEHPLRERMWEHLMTARYRLGRNADALRAFQEVSAHLAEIGVEPGERLRRLEERVLLHDESLNPVRHNLPTTLDDFIGRESELTAVSRLLGENRLVSLVGAGGSGKTRLAIEVAGSMLGRFGDGVFFVSLAEFDDQSLIGSAVARSIGLLTQSDDIDATLQGILQDKSVLLVIDNCEHLIQPISDLIGRLMRAAPRLRVLATSRESLRLPGETVYTVPGMSLPDVGGEASHSDGVKLFMARAEQSHPGFDSLADPEKVAGLCRRLDGMPLAIELAARRAGVISLDELDSRLQESSAVLVAGARTGPPRHQTLEATIDWSYRLLTPEEQEALAKLSVFRGGFDLEMADWILEQDAAPVVASLVDRSLVRAYTGDLDQRRYRLLETIRQFASHRLDELGVHRRTFERHADWCADLSDRIWTLQRRPGRDRVQVSIREEFENLQSAFERSEEMGNSAVAGRIAEGLMWYWSDSGHAARAVAFASRAIETCTDPLRIAEIRTRRGWQMFTLNDAEALLEDTKLAYDTFRSEPASLAKEAVVGSYAHAFSLVPENDVQEGIALAREALDIAREVGEDLGVGLATLQLALSLSWAGESELGYATVLDAIPIVESTADPFGVAYTYLQATTILMNRAEARREALATYPIKLEKWLDRHPTLINWRRAGWMEWTNLQRGDFEGCLSYLDEIREVNHLEGYDDLGDLVPRATAYWMKGELDTAQELVGQCDRIGVQTRWYHDFYPLKVDVLADKCLVDDVRAAANEYLEWDTEDVEQGRKLGALNPWVRAEVNAFLAAEDGSPHRSAAEGAVATMEHLIEHHPPSMTGSPAMETHTTHLMLARAELSRLDGSDPELWNRAFESADFLYFRLYAQVRLGEALLEPGSAPQGIETLEAARIEAERIGAQRLVALADDIISSRP